MRIDRIRINDFRNIPSLDLHLCPGPNVIWGENGQGKTNLIEALWMCTGAKSFRGARDLQTVRFGCTQGSVESVFFAQEREQYLYLILDKKRVGLLNGVAMKSMNEMAGKLCAVVFSPAHLALVKEGPAAKRRFLDTAICQLKPAYLDLLGKYTRVLNQRNQLLKDVRMESSLWDTLELWDDQLCILAAKVIQVRRSYLKKLAPWAQEIYRGISGGREKLALEYRATLGAREREDPMDTHKLRSQLMAARGEDLRLRATTLGPHRDDMEILLDGHSARLYGSQGQQRSCVLALKLAECQLMREYLGEYPVVLLDDVMSELDEARRTYLLNSLRDRQLVLTCCDAGDFRTLEGGQAVRIAAGRTAEIRKF